MRAQILVAIASLAQPGYSENSRIMLAEGCEAPCIERVERLTGRKVQLDYEIKSYRVKWEGLSRPETRMEGYSRFSTIAIAIEYVANHPPKRWVDGLGDPHPKSELWRALVTIARHESAFWLPVHEGRIRGRAGEWCLAQIHPVVLPSLGLEGPDLVGTDLDSTIRCFQAAADVLARSRNLCPPDKQGWFGPALAVYASGVGCSTTPQMVQDRVDTYVKTANVRNLVPDAFLALYLKGEEVGSPQVPRLRAPPPLLNVGIRVLYLAEGTEECPSDENCLHRLAYRDLSSDLKHAAVSILRTHGSNPIGTEIWFTAGSGSVFVAKLEGHLFHKKGVSMFSARLAIPLDHCGSGGDATCGRDDQWQP